MCHLPGLALQAKRLEQLERELTKHRAPLVYQSLDAAAGRGGKKGAPAVFAGAAGAASGWR